MTTFCSRAKDLVEPKVSGALRQLTKPTGTENSGPIHNAGSVWHIEERQP